MWGWHGNAAVELGRGGPGVVGLCLGLLGILLYLPFYVGFQSQAGGILPNFIFGTRLSQFFVMFGPLLVAAVFLLMALARRWRQTLRPGFFAASTCTDRLLGLV